jgi:phage terminase large subunit-like protein
LWPGVTSSFPCVWSSARSRWESPDRRYHFDAVAADKACDFFPDLLQHHIGEFVGQPFRLMEYQAKLLTRPIFGWKRTADGLRRFRKVFSFLPKGAGKSPWGAGTGIYLARCDGEAAAEVYAVANDRQQARTVHDNAKIMIEKSPLLSAGCEILKDSIYWLDTRSLYMVLSSEASSAHGKRPHGVIFDELHGQKNRDLYEALKKSMVKRRQPLMAMITHAGTDDEGICYEEYEYAKGVLANPESDESCLPVIFEATDKDDWTSPAVWARVNPGHGITVKVDGIAQECREAINEPRKRSDFLRYHLNRWVNQATAWIPVDWWDACDAPMLSDEELCQFPCAVGIDMAQKIDLAAAVVAFKLPLDDREQDHAMEILVEDGTGEVVKKTLSLDYRVVLMPAFWLPQETLLERVQQDRVPYDRWAQQGLLTPVDGAIIGSDPIVRYFVGRGGSAGMVKRFPRLKSGVFAYDPAFATEVALALRDTHGLTVAEVLQNYKHMNEACQVFEALVKSKRIVHGGNRLLRWCLENVADKHDDAGRIRPVKPKRTSKRIDGIVAAIMAIGRLMVIPTEKPKRRRGVAKAWTPSGFIPAVPDEVPAHA